MVPGIKHKQGLEFEIWKMGMMNGLSTPLLEMIRNPDSPVMFSLPMILRPTGGNLYLRKMEGSIASTLKQKQLNRLILALK